VSAVVPAKAPAIPSPVKNRKPLNTASVPANALNSKARPKIAILASKSGLRPKRSPIGPDQKAPAMTPRLDHKNATENAEGARCQTCVNGGTAQLIEPTS